MSLVDPGDRFGGLEAKLHPPEHIAERYDNDQRRDHGGDGDDRAVDQTIYDLPRLAGRVEEHPFRSGVVDSEDVEEIADLGAQAWMTGTEMDFLFESSESWDRCGGRLER